MTNIANTVNTANTVATRASEARRTSGMVDITSATTALIEALLSGGDVLAHHLKGDAYLTGKPIYNGGADENGTTFDHLYQVIEQRTHVEKRDTSNADSVTAARLNSQNTIKYQKVFLRFELTNSGWNWTQVDRHEYKAAQDSDTRNQGRISGIYKAFKADKALSDNQQKRVLNMLSLYGLKADIKGQFDTLMECINAADDMSQTQRVNAATKQLNKRVRANDPERKAHSAHNAAQAARNAKQAQA